MLPRLRESGRAGDASDGLGLLSSWAGEVEVDVFSNEEDGE